MKKTTLYSILCSAHMYHHQMAVGVYSVIPKSDFILFSKYLFCEIRHKLGPLAHYKVLLLSVLSKYSINILPLKGLSPMMHHFQSINNNCSLNGEGVRDEKLILLFILL